LKYKAAHDRFMGIVGIDVTKKLVDYAKKKMDKNIALKLRFTIAEVFLIIKLLQFVMTK